MKKNEATTLEKHEFLTQDLLRDIYAGKLGPGQKLSTELELTKL